MPCLGRSPQPIATSKLCIASRISPFFPNAISEVLPSACRRALDSALRLRMSCVVCFYPRNKRALRTLLKLDLILNGRSLSEIFRILHIHLCSHKRKDRPASHRLLGQGVSTRLVANHWLERATGRHGPGSWRSGSLTPLD